MNESRILVEQEVARTACPACGRKELEVMLRCDLVDGECAVTAHCRHCQQFFLVSPKSLERADYPDQLERWVDHWHCSECKRQGGEVRFTCELASRSCFYTVYCKACHPDSL